MNGAYALLSDRIKAAFVDALLLIASMYVISEILNSFEAVPSYVRILLATLLFVLYDPIFTSVYGGTIGHSFSNIQVKKDSNREKNISFPMALLRFILKVTLGWISLLTTTGNPKKKAIHDYAANSVVLKVKDQ